MNKDFNFEFFAKNDLKAKPYLVLLSFEEGRIETISFEKIGQARRWAACRAADCLEWGYRLEMTCIYHRPTKRIVDFNLYDPYAGEEFFEKDFEAEFPEWADL